MQPEDRKRAILDAALRLADEKGLDAVSMRAVAQRAGLTAMALYPHVGSKAELLDQMMGRLVSEMMPADPDAGAAARGDVERDWRQRLQHLARLGRRLFRDHPWAGALIFSRPAVTPEAARATEEVFAALLDAGVPESEVPRLERMLTTVVIGYAASEAGGRFGTGGLERARRGGLTAAIREGALPAFATLARWVEQPVDWDAEFEADLRDLIRFIETVASG
jgi:AcrR family transcriptional regulator